FYPCYGLAEATLFAAGGTPQTPPVVRAFATEALARNAAVETSETSETGETAGIADVAADDGAGRDLVGCGRAWSEQRVVIADAESGVSCPAGRIGEIWIAGPSVAAV